MSTSNMIIFWRQYSFFFLLLFFACKYLLENCRRIGIINSHISKKHVLRSELRHNPLSYKTVLKMLESIFHLAQVNGQCKRIRRSQLVQANIDGTQYM